MKNEILKSIRAECPWRDTLYWFDSIDSTNTRAKALARQGAAQGTVLIAGHQTGGRGRLGRSFLSPAGMGVYLSVILRPQCPPEQLMHLTCAAAVAMCNAAQRCAGIRPGIKWTNDLVWGKRKLGGILTELDIDQKTGLVNYAIIGIGINCSQSTDDFAPELRELAISLSTAAGRPIEAASLAAEMVCALWEMDATLGDKAAMLEAYRASCVTLEQEIVLLRGDEKRYGTALDVDEDGGLVVRFEDGHTETVSSGEVSVRGMYGYA